MKYLLRIMRPWKHEKMRLRKTLLFPFFAGLTLASFSDRRAVAANEWSGDVGGVGEDVDDADLVGMDEELSGKTLSLSELTEKDRDQQKRKYEEDGGHEERAAFNLADEELAEPSEEDMGQGVPQKVVKEEEAEHVDNPEDLEEEKEQPESATSSTAEKAAGQEEVEEGGEKKYGGQLVVTEEDGTTFDVSSLNRQEEVTPPDIPEYVEAKVKFKKQEEEKKKKKEDAKKHRADNNYVSFYEREMATFRAVEEKNQHRFSNDVENAEDNLQAPKNPGFWKRLKHKVDNVVDKLVTRFGSELKE
ncbi:hypothetical protein Esti_005333 [Eimeria stiedai]